jgi:hypothetical protein
MPRFPHFVNTKTEIQNSHFRTQSIIAERELCLSTEDLGIATSVIIAKEEDTGESVAPSEEKTKKK